MFKRSNRSTQYDQNENNNQQTTTTTNIEKSQEIDASTGDFTNVEKTEVSTGKFFFS
jgi:hypothetical protein